MPRLRRFSRRNPNRLSLIHGFAPSLELLEVRLTPAIMGLDFQLLSDNNGVPDAVITRLDDLTHNLNVNQTFWVRVLAWDERGATVTDPGVISLPLNLTWDSSVVTLLTTMPALPVPLDNSILTSSFTLQRAVDPFVPQTANTITGLRAAALPNAGEGAAIGTQIPVDTFTEANSSTNAQFSLLQFKAKAATTNDSPFTLTLAGSMSFTDAAGLDKIVHVERANPAAPPGTNNLPVRQDATNVVNVTEFLRINGTNPTSISGFVYSDSDVSGTLTRDAATGAPTEIGLPNVTMTLKLGTTVIDTTTTGADGWYQFVVNTPGNYTIEETQPAQFFDQLPTAGLVIPTGANPTPVQRGTPGVNRITDILLNEGDTGVDFNFGERPIPTKLNFLASTDSRTLFAKYLGVTAVTFTSTTAEDILVTRNTNDFTVTQGTTTKTFTQPMLTINAKAPNGTQANVKFVGTAADEVAQLWRGGGSLRFGEDYVAPHYALLAINGKEVTIDPVAGPDLAIKNLVVINDSPASDALATTGPTTLQLTSSADTKTGSVTTNADTIIRAISPSAVRTTDTDTDTITEAAKALVDQLIGDWTTIP